MRVFTRAVLVGTAGVLLACGGLGDQVDRAAQGLVGGGGGGGGKAKAKKASKGELQVTTGAAVQVYVDGAPVTFDMAEGYVQRLTPGQHQMEVINALGKTVATEVVTISAGKRTRYQYRTGGRLDALGVTSMPDRPVAAPVPAVTWTAAAPAPTGSVQIEGVESSGRVFVDGRSVGWTEWGGFVSSNLSSGSHGLRVESYGQIIYDGTVDVSSGQNHRCVLALDTFGSWGLDCHWTTPAL